MPRAARPAWAWRPLKPLSVMRVRPGRRGQLGLHVEHCGQQLAFTHGPSPRVYCSSSITWLTPSLVHNDPPVSHPTSA